MSGVYQLGPDWVACTFTCGICLRTFDLALIGDNDDADALVRGHYLSHGPEANAALADRMRRGIASGPVMR